MPWNWNTIHQMLLVQEYAGGQLLQVAQGID
jgi:hypothetical protein